MKTPKECLDEMVTLNQEMDLYDEPVAMCSCNARVKYKCSEESDSGCGKMCLRGSFDIVIQRYPDGLAILDEEGCFLNER